MSNDAAAALQAYDWPGNVRELANAIEHACALCNGSVISPADLPETIQSAREEPTLRADERVLTFAAAERLAIMSALQAAKGNRARAAQLLQIERHRLYRKIRRYQLEHLTRSVAI